MFRWFLPTLVAVVVGLVVLLGSLLPIPLLVSIRADLLRGAAVVAAFAMVLAFANVLRVHFGRLVSKQARQRFASLILLISAIASFILVLMQGPQGVVSQMIVEGVLIPGQSTLLALTAVTLVLAGARLLRTRRTVSSVLFLAVALIVLLTTVPMVYPGILGTVMQFVDAVASGGMRGLLLGVALGTVVTGLRIILGIDRPHSGG
ncbi:MAG: hypothetical protein JXC32_19160 [Anaerolineae bacterium]|nr:hypothetical protein [Anaerolineae bacterium]